MVIQAIDALPSLYEADETAWLEAMSELIRQGRYQELDYANLSEYLADMAIRDRHEVESRIETLIAHLLKWQYQPEKRTGSWRYTIIEQRRQLVRLLGRGVLRNHAEAVLAEAYAGGVELAAAETELPKNTFPSQCPYTLDQLLSWEVPEE